MRTYIDIDDRLMAEAIRACGARTKREAVELGLRALIQRGAPAAIKSYRGKLPWHGELDRMRRDR